MVLMDTMIGVAAEKFMRELVLKVLQLKTVKNDWNVNLPSCEGNR